MRKQDTASKLVIKSNKKSNMMMGFVPVAFGLFAIFSRPIWPFVVIIIVHYALMIFFYFQNRILYDRNGITMGAIRAEKTIYWSQIISVEDRFQVLKRNPSPYRVLVITYRNSRGTMETIRMRFDMYDGLHAFMNFYEDQMHGQVFYDGE